MKPIKRNSSRDYRINLTCMDLKLDVKQSKCQLKGQDRMLRKIIGAIKRRDEDTLRQVDPKYLEGVDVNEYRWDELYRDSVESDLQDRFSGVLTLQYPRFDDSAFFKTRAGDSTLELLLANCNDKGIFALGRGKGQVIHVCYGEEESNGGWSKKDKLSWDEFVEFKKPYSLEVESKGTHRLKPFKVL